MSVHVHRGFGESVQRLPWDRDSLPVVTPLMGAVHGRERKVDIESYAGVADPWQHVRIEAEFPWECMAAITESSRDSSKPVLFRLDHHGLRRECVCEVQAWTVPVNSFLRAILRGLEDVQVYPLPMFSREPTRVMPRRPDPPPLDGMNIMEAVDLIKTFTGRRRVSPQPDPVFRFAFDDPAGDE